MHLSQFLKHDTIYLYLIFLKHLICMLLGFSERLHTQKLHCASFERLRKSDVGRILTGLIETNEEMLL